MDNVTDNQIYIVCKYAAIALQGNKKILLKILERKRFWIREASEEKVNDDDLEYSEDVIYESD